MVSPAAKKTLILTASAIIGLTTVSTLAYLLIQDDRRAKHQRSVRSLQKNLAKKIALVEKSVDELVEGDIRLAQVRTKTLRTHPIYPGDPHVQLLSMGLIQEQDQTDLGTAIEETSDELVRERMLGLAQDPAKVRQGYKRLEFLINSVNEKLLRLLESLDAITPREITDLGDGAGGIPSANGFEVQAFEKIRKRKRSNIDKIHKIMNQLDKIGHSIKDRVLAVEIYDRKVAEEEEEERQKKEEEDKLKKEAEKSAKEQEKKETVHNHAEDDLVREGVSFAQVAASLPVVKAEEKESVSQEQKAKTNGHAEHDLVREGVSFAQVAASHPATVSEKKEEEEEKAHHKHEDSSTSFSMISESEVLEPTEDLEKMKEGVTFADVVAAPAANVEVTADEETTSETTSESSSQVLVEISGSVEDVKTQGLEVEEAVVEAAKEL